MILRKSFESIPLYLEDIKRVKNKIPLCVLVGNKLDKKYYREVTSLEGKQFAEDNKNSPIKFVRLCSSREVDDFIQNF